MSREWVDDMKKPPRRGPDRRDKRFVMRCDCFHPEHGLEAGLAHRCKSRGNPAPIGTQPPLEAYAAAGWFIARLHGDRCPDCLAAGHAPSAEPHVLMEGPL